MINCVFVTVPNKKEANKIASALIKDRLVACVNIVDNIKSVYRWKGKVENSKELLLIIKTKKSAVVKLIKKIKSLHSYTVPEIIAFPITGGNKEYLEWVNDSLATTD